MTPRPAALEVAIDGQVVADLTEGRGPQVNLRYRADTVAADGNQPWLSCSLPVRSRPHDARLFRAGLLPEGRHLESVAARAGVLTTDVFGLLARLRAGRRRRPGDR